MTPVAALIAAVVAGTLLHRRRDVILAVVIPFVVVLAGQTTLLGSGRGTSPPGTAKDPGYWIVQMIALALGLGLAVMLSAWRTRRSGIDSHSSDPRRFLTVAGILTVLAGVGGFLPIALTQPTATHDADGNPPVFGMISVMALVIGTVVLGVVTLRARRASGAPRVGVVGG